MKATVLISKKLNDSPELLARHECKIANFLQKYACTDATFQVGNIYTNGLQKILDSNDFEYTVKRQHPNSLAPSNRNMMMESDIVLIINYQKSSYMIQFEKYAKNLDDGNKKIDVLTLNSI